MQNESHDLINHFLIATPSLTDPLFATSLVYICAQGENGCMGFIINQPSSYRLGEVFAQLDIQCDNPVTLDQPAYIGGPLQLAQGFILHSKINHCQDSQKISPNIYLSRSKDVLTAIAANQGPAEYLVILGFSGWATGQLESELQENSWLISAADAELLFQQHGDKWQVAIDNLGFDINMLSPVSGHA